MFGKIKVPIKNLLYMYSYAWDMVSSQRLIKLAADDNFTSTDIFAELFLINVRYIFQRGLHRQYVEQAADLNVARGKINLLETFTKLKLQHGQIHCEFDELTEDILFNQILKYTATKLYKCQDLKPEHKKSLRQVLIRLNQVTYKEITLKDLKSLVFDRTNIYYGLIIKICELIIKANMLSYRQGEFNFDELFRNKKELDLLFEFFVYNFYRKELPHEYHVQYQNTIKWKLMGGDQSLLPNMKTDIQIEHGEEMLIIDTKFYKTYLTENRGVKKFHSGNIYQMMAYLQNIDYDGSQLRGMLLYPQPYDEPKVRESYLVPVLKREEEVTFQICTVDLSNNWQEIHKELLGLVPLSRAGQ